MQKHTAIILSSRDTNEFDRIYIMYTLEKGLVRAVAKGARKPAARLAGHLEPATLSEVYIARSRGMGQITSSLSVSGYENIKKSFALLETALAILKFFAKNFKEEEKDERIFLLLKEFMEILNSQSLNLVNVEKAGKEGILAEAFWWKLFDFLGQKPEVMKCVACGERLRSKNVIKSKFGFSSAKGGQACSQNSQFLKAKLLNNFFSVIKGGILCASCRKAGSETFLINENQIKLLRIFFANSLKNVQKIKINPTDIESLEKIRINYQKYYFS